MTYWIYKVLALLPLRIKYRIACASSFILQKIFRYRATVVDTNLRNAFPNQDNEWIRKITTRFYQQLVDVAFEIIHVSRMDKEDFKQRVTIHGLDELERLSENRTRSVQVLTIHLGNWEWMMHAASAHGEIPIDPVFRPLNDKGADRFAQEIRSRFGGKPIPMAEVARNVLQNRRRFRALALVADQSPGSRDNVYWTSFLNQPTAFFIGPGTIAKLTRFPVMFARCRRKSRGEYHLDLIPIIENPSLHTAEEIIESYVRIAEQAVLEEPESFLWSNRRWKTVPGEAAKNI